MTRDPVCEIYGRQQSSAVPQPVAHDDAGISWDVKGHLMLVKQFVSESIELRFTRVTARIWYDFGSADS